MFTIVKNYFLFVMCQTNTRENKRISVEIIVDLNDIWIENTTSDKN